MFIGMTCIWQFLAANSILVLLSSSVLNLVLSILALGKMSIRFLEKSGKQKPGNHGSDFLVNRPIHQIKPLKAFSQLNLICI